MCVIGIGMSAVKPALNGIMPGQSACLPAIIGNIAAESMRFTGIDSDYNHKNSLPQRNNY